jgi:CRP-like cAMP-binding protein
MKHALHHNQLVGQLDRHCHDQLLKHGDWVELLPSQQLNTPEVEIEYAYFPTAGVVALIMQQQNDKPIALALIGNEGMVGIAPALGVLYEPYAATVLSAGIALRISVRYLCALKAKNKSFCRALDTYVAIINAQFAQAAVCHGLHDLQQRLACLLLNYSDRVSCTNFAMTQALLASLLGVRRSGINKAATTLQQAQILHYSRGHIHILNPLALLEKACQCYVMDKQSYQAILHV